MEIYIIASVSVINSDPLVCSGFCPRACPKWAEEASAFLLLPISLRSVVIVYVSVFLWPSSVFKYLGRLAMTALYFDEEVHNCPTIKPLSYYSYHTTRDSISLIAMCNTSCDTRVLYDYWCALKWDDCVQSALLKTPCLTSLLMHRLLLMNCADTEIKNRYRQHSRPAIQQSNYFINKTQNKSNRKRVEIHGFP